MKSYSQSQEDLIIKKYFGQFIGNLLSVGENDGETFSNAKLLIDCGWSATLVEPSSVFSKLQSLHNENSKVKCYQIGIGLADETSILFESGPHVIGGNDQALVSSVDYAETEKWRDSGVEFNETPIILKTFKTFYDEINHPIFDFITIDAESFDWEILQQINLKKVGCRCLIIEWNGDKRLEKKFTTYCLKYKLKPIHKNSENIIYVR